MKEKIKVLRPFILNGAPTKVGDVIEVSKSFSIELCTAKKAEKHVEPAKEPESKSVSKATAPKGEK